jgi:uncharacterized delta-60 repeat protein
MQIRRLRLIGAVALSAGIAAGFTGSTTANGGPQAGWLDPTFGIHGVVAVPTATSAHDADGLVGVGSTGRIAVSTTYGTASGGARNELTVFTASGHLDGSFHGGHPVSLFSDPVGECCGADGPFVTADRGVDVGLVTDGTIIVQRYGSTGIRAWTSIIGAVDPSADAVLAGGSVRALGVESLTDQATPPPLLLLGLTSAGARDTRVGPNGIRVLAQLHGPHELVADAANRLYVVGNTYADLNAAPAGRSMMISRLSSSGVVDTTYGTAGTTTIAVDDIDGSPSRDGIALAPDGSLFIAGEQARPSGSKVVIRKLDPSGMPDAGFGTGGVAEVPGRRMIAIAVDPTGRPILSILAHGGTPKPEIVRLDATTGGLDSSFGVAGIVAVSGLVTDLAVSPDGKLLTVSRVVRNGVFVEYLGRRTL